jgi:uncharacterized protein YegL
MSTGSQPTPTFGAPGEEKEPMLLLDTTSMNYPTEDGGHTKRRETIQEAIKLVVAELAKHDSQAEREEGGGGLRTITFAGGEAVDIEDLNPDNLSAKWRQIRWGGGTYIMPGLQKLLEVYKEEFGSRPANERPMLMALVITDGEAEDTNDFARAISQVGSSMYVALAILGFGDEHDRALRAYQQIEAKNKHVKVVTFGSEISPDVIARALLRMIE